MSAIIGIDYTPAIEQGGGIGRYVRELMTALAQLPEKKYTYRLFVSGTHPQNLPAPLAPHFDWASTSITPDWFARIWHRARVPVPVETWTGAISLFHATDFTLPPTRRGTKTLLTVHDLSFVRVPETASPSLKAYLDTVVPRSVTQANHILADSTATRNDLIALYHTPPEKITVLLSGVEPRFHPIDDTEAINATRLKYRLPHRPYIFSVGTVQPRKNYMRMIEAVAQLRERGRDIGYVIAGGKGWLDDPIYATIERLGLQDCIHTIGFADDTDLPALYNGASIVAVPSLYEGFGIPVLEGMACGIPVITSNISSLPEVAGDAALLIDPTDLDAMIDGIERLLTDETRRAGQIHRGLEQVKNFTWHRAARQLLTVYEQILSD